MRILVSFPGRSGDLIWALPSIRAISEAYGQRVDLLIAGEFAGMLPLLRAAAPYLGRVEADPGWSLTPPNEWQPPTGWTCMEASRDYDLVFHLGYRGWPDQDLAQYTWQQALDLCVEAGMQIGPPDLLRPWLTVEGPGIPLDIAVGFTEAYFEMKLGLLTSMENQLGGQTLVQLTPPGSRWDSVETQGIVSVEGCDWLTAARAIRNSDLFLGDCSALHVLARALGKPVVLCEPMEGRWNDIFYPYGKSGHGVELVTGNDGLPTFDARAVAAVVKGVLRAIR